MIENIIAIMGVIGIIITIIVVVHDGDRCLY